MYPTVSTEPPLAYVGVAENWKIILTDWEKQHS